MQVITGCRKSSGLQKCWFFVLLVPDMRKACVPENCNELVWLRRFRCGEGGQGGEDDVSSFVIRFQEGDHLGVLVGTKLRLGRPGDSLAHVASQFSKRHRPVVVGISLARSPFKSSR